MPLDERDGRAPSARSVFNKLASASRQAGVVVLNGLGRGITPIVARQGVLLYGERGVSEEISRGREISKVRVLGDGFDLAFSRAPSLLRRRAHDRSAGRSQPSDGPPPAGDRVQERRPPPDHGLGL